MGKKVISSEYNILGFTKKYFSIDENVSCVGICQHNKQKCDEDEQCVDYDKGSLL